MIIGVPKEIKPAEARVALTPAGVAAFVERGHRVHLETGAGLGSGIADQDYEKAGAQIADVAEDVWTESEMIVKVKEPLESEYPLLRPGLLLYTYLHLASNEPLMRALLDGRVTAIGYETIQLCDGTLPLLAPMSAVAGRLAVQAGARCLESPMGGAGILLGGVPGVMPAKVVIVGAGVAGSNACTIALGMGARVTVLDIDVARLGHLADVTGRRVTTLFSTPAAVAEQVSKADLVIGAVLVPGARAPRIISEDMVRGMRPGSVIVDIAIDQGGCVETARPTTHDNPTYRVHDVVHYCVANIPGAVPRTSTHALTNVTLRYGLALADKGWERATAECEPLARGVNTHDGSIRHPAVAQAFSPAADDTTA